MGVMYGSLKAHDIDLPCLYALFTALKCMAHIAGISGKQPIFFDWCMFECIAEASARSKLIDRMYLHKNAAHMRVARLFFLCFLSFCTTDCNFRAASRMASQNTSLIEYTWSSRPDVHSSRGG
jgi:hypothetical protein